jgi:hypothetical protein
MKMRLGPRPTPTALTKAKRKFVRRGDKHSIFTRPTKRSPHPLADPAVAAPDCLAAASIEAKRPPSGFRMDRFATLATPPLDSAIRRRAIRRICGSSPYLERRTELTALTAHTFFRATGTQSCQPGQRFVGIKRTDRTGSNASKVLKPRLSAAM